MVISINLLNSLNATTGPIVKNAENMHFFSLNRRFCDYVSEFYDVFEINELKFSALERPDSDKSFDAGRL